MPTTTYWTWTVVCDEPRTGRRITRQGETIASADATSESVRERLYPDLNEDLARRYGLGYDIQDLAPAWCIEQQ
ncbi:hypothetical protein [Streptomyces achromogenes]|uniref:hypothetical protein n=1 Tax=Streptomyces achromogenes TaxID=67255 RepID=UPI0004CBBCDB|nr:hypothetical protein [Streptomyces achromogenes]